MVAARVKWQLPVKTYWPVSPKTTMRLTPAAISSIKKTVAIYAGDTSQVKLFGSRLDDSKKGGDIDLLVTLDHPVENPALLIAKLTAELIKAMNGRKVDVLLIAPNLTKKNIHDMAEKEGKLL